MNAINLFPEELLIDKKLLNQVKKKKKEFFEGCINGNLDILKVANKRKLAQKVRKLAGQYEVKREFDPDGIETEKEMTKGIINAWKYLKSSEFNPKNISSQNIVEVGRLISKKVAEKHPNAFRYEAIQIGRRIYDNWQQIPYLIENMNALGNQIEDPLVKAIYYHIELVHIHPLIDGNGRTARSIEARILRDENILIPIIPVCEKLKYNKIIDDACVEIDNGKINGTILKATSYLLNRINNSFNYISLQCQLNSRKQKRK